MAELLLLKVYQFTLNRLVLVPDEPLQQQVLTDTETHQSSDSEASAELSFGDGFADMLCYVFYLPLFFTGPILTYDLFKSQVSTGY